jgi:hypothetical protein
MSEKIKIIGNSIISDSYATSVVTGLPERPSKTPEQFEQERLADRVKHFDLLREMRWSAQDYETAKTLGFPERILYIHNARGIENIYSRRRIAAWANELRAMAARLQDVASSIRPRK